MAQELYELPEGWTSSNIGAVAAKLTTGKTPSKKIEAYYAKPEILWFTPSDFSGQALLTNSKRKLDQQAVDDGVIKLAEPYTVLLVAIGATIGKVGINPQAAFFNQQITGIQFSKKIDPKYAYYWLTYIKPEILQNAGQATLPIINQKGIKALSFNYPNLPEQQRLVKKLDALLSRIDTAITHLQHSLELNDQLFASSLKQAFNPLDAEVQPDGTYQLPEDWEWLEFKKIFSTKGYSVGKIKNSEYKAEGAYPVIDQSQKYIAGYFDEHDLVYQGELPVLIYGDHTNAVKYVDFKFISGADGTKVLTISDQVASKYAYYLVDRFKPETQGYRRHFSILNKILLPVCMLDEQNKIARALELIEIKTQENKQVLQRKLEQLQQLKTSLLDSTFKGNL